MAWYMTDSGLYNDEFISLPAKPIEKPFPYALWRISSSVNSGVPYNELLPDIRGIDLWALERKRTIHVYDLHEPQTGFDGNGLAILDPIECTSVHNDERWEITLRHPLDEWGKWKNLLVNNVLKVDGQLFRIDTSQPEISESGREIKVHAKHISYDLNDLLIHFATFDGGNAERFIQFTQSSVEGQWEKEWAHTEQYEFEGHSDIETVLGAEEYVNVTFWGAMVGADNSLMNRYGGELYRDNFYFSINNRMQYAHDNAFYLRYSLDMVKILQKVDYSDFCTALYCYDNYGQMWGITNVAINDRMHHAITRMVQFNYSECDMDRLIADGNAYWKTVCYPKITYEIEIAALKDDERYADFVNLQNYNYGDSGTIYCPELDINEVQKIVEVEKDELTGNITRMVLGNLASSFVRPRYMGSTITSGNSAADKQNRAVQESVITTDINGMEQFPICRTEIMKISKLEGK